MTNCQCDIVRHFINGSTSTTENTGRWSYVCTDCKLPVMQTPATDNDMTDSEETAVLITRGFASGRSREALDRLASWAEEE